LAKRKVENKFLSNLLILFENEKFKRRIGQI
jgi:hypothetical protein